MNSSWTRFNPVVKFGDIRVFQACTFDQRIHLTQVPKSVFSRTWRFAQVRLLPFFLSDHMVVVFVRTLSTTKLSHPTASWLKNKTARIHSPYFTKLMTEPREPIHAELLRLATELEAVKSQVQTECNVLLCTDHHRHVKFRFTARPETEPQGSWKTLATAIRRKPS